MIIVMVEFNVLDTEPLETDDPFLNIQRKIFNVA